MMSEGGPALGAADQDERWLEWISSGTNRSSSFDEHWAAFQRIVADRPASAGPPVAWRPQRGHTEGSNVARLRGELGFSSYEELYRWSIRHPQEFWAAAIKRLQIAFERPPSRILDTSGGMEFPQWLPDARLNIAASCLGHSSRKRAVVWRREGDPEIRSLDARALAARVAEFASGFASAGLGPGDRLGFYLPLTADCVAAYLGAIWIGLEVVSIASSLAGPELKRRLEVGECGVLLTVGRYLRAGRRHSPYGVAVEAGAPRTLLLAEAGEPIELRDGDLLLGELTGGVASPAMIGDAQQITNVLFSSGTTGNPKAIPWSQLQPIKCAMDGHFHQDIRPGDVVAWPTDIGWMMGPWLVYSSLINGATIALFDGAPTGPEFARFVEDAGVTMLGVVPSLVRAWRRTRCVEPSAWTSIRTFSSTGEVSNQEDYLWLMSRAGYRAPVIEYCGGTEIGGGYASGTVVQAASPAMFTTPTLGTGLAILGPDGVPVRESESGEVFLIPPALGLSQSLLNADHNEVYFDGCPPGPQGETLRRHGDEMMRLPGGFVQALGRVDDTMNLGGVKVSSIEIERAINRHGAVTESAAVSVPVPGGGPDELVVFAVSATEVAQSELLADLRQLVAAELSPLFKVARLEIVGQLPRTASNKVMRRKLRARVMADGDADG